LYCGGRVMVTDLARHQIANGLSNVKMDDITVAKKNLNSSLESLKKPVDAENLKPEPKEIDEPILTENKHRFVLFPIKYHEVSAIVSIRTIVVERRLTWPLDLENV
jgi:hypothetical protein